MFRYISIMSLTYLKILLYAVTCNMCIYMFAAVLKCRYLSNKHRACQMFQWASRLLKEFDQMETENVHLLKGFAGLIQHENLQGNFVILCLVECQLEKPFFSKNCCRSWLYINQISISGLVSIWVLIILLVI